MFNAALISIKIQMLLSSFFPAILHLIFVFTFVKFTRYLTLINRERRSCATIFEIKSEQFAYSIGSLIVRMIVIMNSRLILMKPNFSVSVQSHKNCNHILS